MVLRVSENLKFNTMVGNLFKIENDYADLAEKVSSQKRINKPSDDPIGTSAVLTLRESKASFEQFQKNIDSCKSWLTVTETNLSAVDETLMEAKDIAMLQANGTVTSVERSSAASAVQGLIEQMQALANAKYGDRYIFGGSRTDSVPFPSVTPAPQIGDPVAGKTNIFDGDVGAGGDYTGLENKEYTVKIVDTGAPGAATYQHSTDGGGNWLPPTPETVSAAGIASLDNGVDLIFGGGTQLLTAGDTFTMRAFSNSAPSIEDPVAAGGNGGFNGTVQVSPGSSYTGEVNKSYVIKITGDGSVGTAPCQISDDGGKNWVDASLNAVVPATVPPSATIDAGDGVALTFSENVAEPPVDLAEGDIFYVRAFTDGYYTGDNAELSADIGNNVPFEYSVQGELVFTDKGDGGVDIFKILNDLKTYLENDDQGGIGLQLDTLENASIQVNNYIAECGTRSNRLDIAENNLCDISLSITEMISNKEDADFTEIATQLAMKQVALNAAYALASKIDESSILNFLR